MAIVAGVGDETLRLGLDQNGCSRSEELVALKGDHCGSDGEEGEDEGFADI